MNRALADINSQAYELLFRELGPVDAVRFLNQFHLGSGNYTEERRAWAEKLTVDDIARQIKQLRSPAQETK
jgi:hypothetical protein